MRKQGGTSTHMSYGMSGDQGYIPACLRNILAARAPVSPAPAMSTRFAVGLLGDRTSRAAAECVACTRCGGAAARSLAAESVRYGVEFKSE